MKTFRIIAAQHFVTTYIVEADSPEEAWESLIDGNDALAVDQEPGAILGTFADATITEEP